MLPSLPPEAGVIYGGAALSGEYAGHSRQGWASPSFRVAIKSQKPSVECGRPINHVPSRTTAGA